MSAIECFTSSTATKIDVALLDKEAGDVALIYGIGLDLQKENNSLKARIQHLEDIINRAHLAFFSDSSDRKVSIAMHRILDEEVRKEAKP